MPYIRSEMPRPSILLSIHSMDHLASLTSLSRIFYPSPIKRSRGRLQPFFSQFEYIVPSADIHMYIRPILFPFLAPLFQPLEAFLPGSSPSVSLLRLFLFPRDSHTYRSFYLANPTGGFVVAWPSFSSFLPFFFSRPSCPRARARRPLQCIWFWFIWRDRQLESATRERERGVPRDAWKL